MMHLIRLILMVASLVCLGLMSSEMWRTWPTWQQAFREPAVLILWFVAWFGLALNISYLAANRPLGTQWRIFKLMSLWLDAKEQELTACLPPSTQAVLR
jgi:hypothetical protein